MDNFKALWVEKSDHSTFIRTVKRIPVAKLPKNDVLIEVKFSSLNYKDALSAFGNAGVTKNYPFIPGIDAAGIVLEDKTHTFSPGDKVIVTSYDLGMNTFGGFGELISVPRDWIVPLPENLDLFTSMVFGTAGYTAFYGVKRLQREHITPDSGNVLVTGATGGVGSMTVFILAQMGYNVIAATGKMSLKNQLLNLGAKEVIHRDSLYPQKPKLLDAGKFIAAIDTVGGKMLESIIPQIQHNGAIVCCGNVLGHNIETNIYPFILRGISLLGIDSGITKMELRKKIWDDISNIDADFPKDWIKTIKLDGINEELEKLYSGKQSGRVVLAH